MTVTFAPSGPFAMLTLVAAILGATLVSAAAATMIVVFASLFATCVLLAHGFLSAMRRHAENSFFEQIESPVGMALPLAATQELAWWTAKAGHPDAHTHAWTGTGRMATPILGARTVTFIRLW